jgi:hypothetical protein
MGGGWSDQLDGKELEMSYDHDQTPESSKALFGPPPVLSTEEPKQFDALFKQVVVCLKPRDALELILTRHFV